MTEDDIRSSGSDFNYKSGSVRTRSPDLKKKGVPGHKIIVLCIVNVIGIMNIIIANTI